MLTWLQHLEAREASAKPVDILKIKACEILLNGRIKRVSFYWLPPQVVSGSVYERATDF
jgi:hypothetical protein